MPDIQVWVDGQNRSKLVDRRVGALSYSRDINGQGNARFTIADEPSGFVPADGMEVLIKEDGTDRFGGIINARPRQFAGPDSAKQLTFYAISAASWEQRLNKRRVWRSYTDTTFEDIVADLASDFLSGEGLTTSVLAGSTLSITFNGETVAEALDVLCSLETDGRSWYVTPGKVLTIDVQSATAAPVELNRRNLDLERQPTVEPDRNGYANTVTVVGGNPDFPILYTARDATEIAARVSAEGGSGIYHDVVEDNEIVTELQAQVRAEGILLQRKVLREKFTGRTRESGFAVGQQVTVDLPNLGIDETDYFIIGVETSLAPGARELWHTITAVDGFLDGSWHSEYRRKIAPKTIPMQIEATPGLVRVEPEAGPLVHDPPREPHEWFQGALSGALSATPSAVGISTDGDFMYTVRRGPAATPRQTIAEGWPIDEDNVVATSPTISASWNEFFSTGINLKSPFAVSPNSRYIAVVAYEADVGDGTFIVVDMVAGVRLGVCNSTMSDQTNAGDPLWVGDYVYLPDVTSGDIYVYDVTDRNNPTEAAVFSTSLTVVQSVIAEDASGAVLYASGTGGIVSLDASSPTALSEVDTAGAADYASIDIDGRGYIAGAVRADSSNVNVIIVEADGTTLTVLFEGNVALATTSMEGVAAVHHEDALMVLNVRGVSSINNLRAHVFNTADTSAPTFTETISYTHGASGNRGPARSTEARKILYTFNDGSDTQIVYGQTDFDKVVPYSIDSPALRAAFGGTGLTSYVVGNLLVATGRETIGTVLPPAGDDEVLVYDSAEPGLMKWAKLKPASAAAAVWLLEY